jgi:hypothetical protein
MVTGYFRPSLYNKPLPRLKPQPISISMMIKKRRLARERKGEKYGELVQWRDDLRKEALFEDLAFKGEKSLGDGGVTQNKSEKNMPFSAKYAQEWGAFLFLAV